MSAANPLQIFRPLWSGVGIVSDLVQRRGTVGCFALDGAGGTWLLTAAHVIFPAPPVRGSLVSVYQPDKFTQLVPINAPQQWRIDATGDVVAVQLLPEIKVRSQALGLPAWSGVRAPTSASLAMKMGVTTGVTLGQVGPVSGSDFTVATLEGLPAGYKTEDAGDSGAAWIDQHSLGIIGIHVGERFGGVAYVRRLDAALLSLGLVLRNEI